MSRSASSEGHEAEIGIDVVAHTALTADDIGGLRRLFDAEYPQGFGDWDPDLPYGYASHDVHVIARRGGKAVGHVGWARRVIRVGDREIVIAGVGGVLVSDRARGERRGDRLMHPCGGVNGGDGRHRVRLSRVSGRSGLVLAACGWTRISAAERSISRAEQPVSDPPGQPLLVLPIEYRLVSWPAGEVDLRGRAW